MQNIFNLHIPEYQRAGNFQSMEDYLLGVLVDYDDEERAGKIIKCLKEAGAITAKDTTKE